MSGMHGSDGRWYYGAQPRMVIEVEPNEDVSAGYDPDASDTINARRFFGFSDYGEVCPVALLSRFIQRAKHSERQAIHWYKVLTGKVPAHLCPKTPAKTYRQMIDG